MPNSPTRRTRRWRGAVVVAVATLTLIVATGAVALYALRAQATPIGNPPPPSLHSRGPSVGGSPAATTTRASERQLRDIYLINLDNYANQATLEQIYGFDNSAFLDALRERGFYVATEARANYLKSAFTITATFEMDYLDTAALAEQAAAPNDFGPLFEMLKDALRAQRLLKFRGYTYVHMGSWWQGTAMNFAADYNFRYDHPVRATPTGWRVPGFRDVHRQHTLFQLDYLPRVAHIPGPKFVFAHIALPHEPAVFDRSGDLVTEEIERSRTREENYTESLLYANRRILEVLDVLMAGPEETDPIVILYSDEGPYPTRYRRNLTHFRWDQATLAELQTKFGILNAFYLPGVDPEDAGLHPSISPVNTFRVVFNAYLGTDLPLLPDRQLIWPDAFRIYETIDVTDVLAESAASPSPAPP